LLKMNEREKDSGEEYHLNGDKLKQGKISKSI